MVYFLGIVYFVISLCIFMLLFWLSYKLITWIESVRDSKLADSSKLIGKANIPTKAISVIKINSTPARAYKLTIEKQKETLSYNLDKETFRELMNKYFVDVEYLAYLYQNFPYDLTLTNNLKRHYSTDNLSDKVIGFIKIQSSHIYVKKSLNKMQRTNILLHELAHALQFRNNPGKNLAHHGKEFRKEHKMLLNSRDKFYEKLVY